MRFDKPVGIWLLMWPGFWSLTLASEQLPLFYYFLFFLGACFMRAAGCIVNDLADRDIDRQVARTAKRPLASGEVSKPEALVLLSSLLFLSLIIAVMLGALVVKLALFWLILIAAYPYMKRITWWPQLFLGLTFNAGALFGWAAVKGIIELPAVLLYLGAIGWTLGYDTIYAHQDKEDDARIGIKSTALRLGEKTKFWVGIFYAWFIVCWVVTGVYVQASMRYYFLLVGAGLHLASQLLSARLNDPSSCLKAFNRNRWTGIILWLAALIK